MAILAYDDVMLREPRLLVPGQQPLGPVRVDRNYDCIAFAMFGGGVKAKTGNFNRDLVNPTSVMTFDAGFSVAIDYAVSANVASSSAYLSWVRGALAPPYTIFAGFDFIVGAVSWSLLSGLWTGVYAGAADGKLVTTNASDFSGDFTAAPGPRLPNAPVDFCALSVGGTNSGFACANGGAIVTDTSFVAPSYTPAYFAIGSSIAGANQTAARVACFAVFKTAMSAGEIQALTRNPYAPLIPA